jgi:hypothetical protein
LVEFAQLQQKYCTLLTEIAQLHNANERIWSKSCDCIMQMNKFDQICAIALLQMNNFSQNYAFA